MPRLSEDAIHCATIFIRDSNSFSREIKIGQTFLIRTYDMFMSSSQLIRTVHKQELTEMIRDRCVKIVIPCRLIIFLLLSFLSHPLMHRSACRPFSIPIIPTLNALCHILKVIGVYPIRKKSRSPVVNCDLHSFFNSHRLFLSDITCELSSYLCKGG